MNDESWRQRREKFKEDVFEIYMALSKKQKNPGEEAPGAEERIRSISF
jgi:hypothetical protein